MALRIAHGMYLKVHEGEDGKSFPIALKTRKNEMKLFLWCIVIGSIVTAGFAIFFLCNLLTTAHIAHAKDQIEVFYNMKKQAKEAETYDKVMPFLEYTINYYPSGTKQAKGTLLDMIVEQVRQEVICDINEILRQKKVSSRVPVQPPLQQENKAILQPKTKQKPVRNGDDGTITTNKNGRTCRRRVMVAPRGL